MKMLSAVLRDFNDLRMEELPVPEPGAGEVLVRIKSCGFCANVFIGIPTGVMLQRIGYKRTSLLAIALGFVGMLVQWASGWLGVGSTLGGVAANFFAYLAVFAFFLSRPSETR